MLRWCTMCRYEDV